MKRINIVIVRLGCRHRIGHHPKFWIIADVQDVMVLLGETESSKPVEVLFRKPLDVENAKDGWRFALECLSDLLFSVSLKLLSLHFPFLIMSFIKHSTIANFSIIESLNFS